MGTSPDSIRVVGESDLLELAHCARSTWQYWCRKGLLDEAATGLYGEPEVVEVLVVGMLVSALDVRRATAVWRTSREKVLPACTATAIDGDEELDAVIDLYSWEAALAQSPEAVQNLTHKVLASPRGYVVLPLTPWVREARSAFWVRAVAPSALARDKRRKADRARTGRQGGQNPARPS